MAAYNMQHNLKVNKVINISICQQPGYEALNWKFEEKINKK